MNHQFEYSYDDLLEDRQPSVFNASKQKALYLEMLGGQYVDSNSTGQILVRLDVTNPATLLTKLYSEISRIDSSIANNPTIQERFILDTQREVCIEMIYALESTDKKEMP